MTSPRNPSLVLTDEVAAALAEGASRGRAGEHDHQPRHALPPERRDGPRGGGHHPRRRRHSGHDRGAGWAALHRPVPGRPRVARLRSVGDQGERPGSAVRRGAGSARGHHRGRHHAAGRAGRHSGLRDRRPRRRTPRRCGEFRRQRRPDRVVGDAGCGGLGRGEEHPRHRADPGVVGDARGAGAWPSAPTSSRRSTPDRAVSGRRCAWNRPRRSLRSCALNGTWGCRPGW